MGPSGKEGMAVKVTKDTVIADVLKQDSGTAQFLFAMGMHCVGCAAASGETLAQACEVHGADVDALVSQINKYLEENKK
jgi:hybrid cluster-associated redox disulfide protein